MIWHLHENTSVEHLGLIPSFIKEEDERPAREQFDANYAFGGWRPIEGFRLKRKQGPYPLSIQYPGDPELNPIAFTTLHGREVIVMFPHALVLIVGHNGTFEVARLD